jgi:hypothetical protein
MHTRNLYRTKKAFLHLLSPEFAPSFAIQFFSDSAVNFYCGLLSEDELHFDPTSLKLVTSTLFGFAPTADSAASAVVPVTSISWPT